MLGLHFHAVCAIAKRNFAAYFSNPAGYVFITIFIVVTAWVAFAQDAFFASNLADLATLNARMPWLLMIFVPAITMGLWAEERKLGTSELLLTLPVSDLDVVLGKYLAAAGVYTVSLVFTLSLGLVLEYLGNPDWGLLLANFAGYWMLGAALISLGLLASVLTGNQTVAFILGAVFCGVVLLAEELAVLALGPASTIAKGIGVKAHFENFTLGVITLPDVLFFVLTTGAVLYLSLVMLGRRHWRGGRQGRDLWWHLALRSASVVVAAVSVGLLAGRWMSGARADATAEKINTPLQEMYELIKKLPGDQPIYIRAFISPEVPEEYEPTRQSMLRMLRAIEGSGGGRIIVDLKAAEPYSDQARQADDLGIRPQEVPQGAGGRQGPRKIFLGVAMSSGSRQELIPFMQRGWSVEYELGRSLLAVANATRRKVGVLQTDVGMMGGMNFQAMRQIPPWPIVEELKKQYEVVSVSADAPVGKENPIDVLIAPQPVSLTPPQFKNLSDYVLSGKPVLLMVDPLPVAVGRAPFSARPELGRLLDQLGLRWNPMEIVCDGLRPARFLVAPPQYLFLSSGSGSVAANDPVTRDLSSVVLIFAGSLEAIPDSGMKVTPLLKASGDSGLQPISALRDFLSGMGPPVQEFKRSDRAPVLAVRVSGRFQAETENNPVGPEARAIVIGDLDLMGTEFFALRALGERDLRFDNITFVLNCVDSLVGDASTIALRSHQAKYRPLERIEKERGVFQETLQKKEEEAEAQAGKALDSAQEEFGNAAKDIEARTDLNQTTKEIMMAQALKIALQRLENEKARIEADKVGRVGKAQDELQMNVRRIEARVKRWAVVLPALPPVLIGLAVLVLQLVRERTGTPLSRSMRQS